eukprot:TRINITY_DN1403_c0_g1_i1.p1 TRINITY_DN1403_c0_g1~~TRINITY_DN1403_c0_g1_i1.p1  ORF type:complete len:135 (+),score=36.51 TRINITY_DN1403_c0_g1_i1:425-829(+)
MATMATLAAVPATFAPPSSTHLLTPVLSSILASCPQTPDCSTAPASPTTAMHACSFELRLPGMASAIINLLSCTALAAFLAAARSLLTSCSARMHSNHNNNPRTPVSYTHLRAHETPEHLVCRLLLEKKKKNKK